MCGVVSTAMRVEDLAAESAALVDCISGGYLFLGIEGATDATDSVRTEMEGAPRIKHAAASIRTPNRPTAAEHADCHLVP
jgi:hypothetical protein